MADFDLDMASVQAQNRMAMIFRRVANRQVIPESVRRTATYDVVPDAMEGLIVSLSAYVLSHKVDEQDIPVHFTIEHEAWESWWQHTKAIHFPTLSRWLRRPPRKVTAQIRQTKHVKVERWATFPDADAYPPELGKPVYVQQVTPPWSEG